ncbi:MAG: beta-N-acetylhexosaminidase, partial [Flavobacteriales bacterium]
MHFKSLFTLLVLSLFIGCTQTTLIPETPQIIPVPNSIAVNNQVCILDKDFNLSVDSELSESADFLNEILEKGLGYKLESSNSHKTLILSYDSSISNEEGYKLLVSPNKIKIKASSNKGAFYAIQTLRQLLPPSFENSSYSNKSVAIQCLRIQDKPKFVYRGMHLDVGRHLFPVEFIKKYIDRMAMLKMNTFHWHLTEDQGWRIEIKKYPKLQEIAAFRNQTLIGHYNDQPQSFDGKKYGGFYTQEEIKEIVKYAQERHITIIPEIEMPGHSQAAISAYPELSCERKKVKVAEKWGVFEPIYCSKDSTFQFIENVLDEVLELFPSEYIHIGGDEAPKAKWKACDNCQKRIKSEGLKDEHGLQSYFISRIEKYLNSKGRKIIGWDEILEGGLAPNASVMSWRGTKGAVEAAKQGHNVILTPGSHCYFDHYQSESKTEPIAIGGFLPLEKVYNFNPIPNELTGEQSNRVLGAQGNVWTEYMPNSEKVEYMVFPRILALSEVVWSNPKQKDFTDFVSRVENFHKRLDALNVNYANHLYEIEGRVISKNDSIFFNMNIQSSEKNIRYTPDGSEPKIDSEIYTKPIPILNSTTIKAATFNSKNKVGSILTQEINF